MSCNLNTLSKDPFGLICTFIALTGTKRDLPSLSRVDKVCQGKVKTALLAICTTFSKDLYRSCSKHPKFVENVFYAKLILKVTTRAEKKAFKEIRQMALKMGARFQESSEEMQARLQSSNNRRLFISVIGSATLTTIASNILLSGLSDYGYVGTLTKFGINVTIFLKCVKKIFNSFDHQYDYHDPSHELLEKIRAFIHPNIFIKIDNKLYHLPKLSTLEPKQFPQYQRIAISAAFLTVTYSIKQGKNRFFNIKNFSSFTGFLSSLVKQINQVIIKSKLAVKKFNEGDETLKESEVIEKLVLAEN